MLAVPFGRQPGNNDYNLSFRLFGPEVFEHLRESATAVLFVQFGDLTRHRTFPFGAENLRKLLQRLYQTPW